MLELYSNETVHYIDLISRDVYLPLLSCNLVLSDQEKDRFLDLFHRLLNQTAATHTFQSDSVVLPLPAFNILAHISQHEPQRQQMILSILENTLTNWSKQIKVRLSSSLPLIVSVLFCSAIVARRFPLGSESFVGLFDQRSDSVVDIENQQVEQSSRSIGFALRRRCLEEFGQKSFALLGRLSRHQNSHRQGQPSSLLPSHFDRLSFSLSPMPNGISPSSAPCHPGSSKSFNSIRSMKSSAFCPR